MKYVGNKKKFYLSPYLLTVSKVISLFISNLNKIIVFYACSFISISVYSQCPGIDSIYKRLVFLTNTSSQSYTPVQLREQLKELSNYEEKIKVCNYKLDSTYALLLQRIGAIYYKQGEYLQAAKLTRKSIGIITDHGANPSGLIKLLIKNYYNLSVYYALLNSVVYKMEAIDSCITVAVRTKFVDYTSLYALVQKVEYLFDIGDFDRCIRFATLGEKITSQYINGQDSIGFVITFSVLKVNSLKSFKNYDLAEKLLSSKIEDCKKIGATQHLGTIYELLAEVDFYYGNIRNAEFYFRQAIKYDQEVGFNLGCMQTLNNIGYKLYGQHYRDSRKALKTYRKALRYENKENPDELERLELLNVFTNIANVYVHDDHYDSAFHYFQLAFDQLGVGFSEKNLSDKLETIILSRKIDYITGLVIDKGDAYLHQYKKTKKSKLLPEVIQVYKAADRLLDRIKSEHSEIQSKLFWRQDTRRLYEHAIEACYANNNINDAFYFFEKSRSVLLNDQLNELHYLNDDDILMQTQLKKKITELERESKNSVLTQIRHDEIQNELFFNKQELDGLLRSLKARNHLFYHSFIDTTFVTLQQVQSKVLHEHSAMAELFAGDSTVYAMTITVKKIYFSKITKSIFDSTVNLYTSYISNESLLNKNFDKFISTSHKLYEQLFGNISVPAGRIIIALDGTYFPFEALVSSNPDQPVRYFVEEHSVSYTYSARYLTSQIKRTYDSASLDLLGIAPVNFPDNWNLTTLPQSDRSLKQLFNYFKGLDLLLFKRASKNNFLQNFHKYKIIQLYTHASTGGKSGEPVIYFSDSALYLSDLIPTKKPLTDLIVLSACETGIGKLYIGEGVFNFSRGFAAFGIPSSISNLWAVDNESTYKLTELFYKYLSERMPADVALQKAKITFLKTSSKEKKLPYFWAAAILVGRSDAIDFTKSYYDSWKIVVLIISIACLPFVFWNFGTKKRKS